MGTIVVGVDGSPGAQAALRFALVEARLRGARLVCLYAFRLPLAEGLPGPFLLEFPAAGGPPLEEARAALRAQAEHVLAAAVAEALADGGAEVAVEHRVVEAAPARALVEASTGADLLVVGSRGHGGFAGLLLGSVGHTCAQHARCPVAIVPAPGERG